jgi:GTPase SAR1 family protein
VERNRIVVLGPKNAGKTIYLASLYGQLYKAPVSGNFSGQAVTGRTHLKLMDVYDELRAGKWPASTTGAEDLLEVQIEHDGQQHLLATLDFAGELFTQAFLGGDITEGITKHIDAAKAVMLLFDPASANERDEFVMIQAVQRVRDSVGGDRVPIVILLTKYDQNVATIQSRGGPVQFVRDLFPALSRHVKAVHIFCVSCVQSIDGKPHLHSFNVKEPFDFCLKEIEKNDAAVYQQFDGKLFKKREHIVHTREQKENYALIFVIVSIFVLGAIITVVLVRYDLLKL